MLQLSLNWSLFAVYFQTTFKVQILWEGHKIWKNIPPFFKNYLVTCKQSWNFFKSLRLSKKIWTLSQFISIHGKNWKVFNYYYFYISYLNSLYNVHTSSVHDVTTFSRKWLTIASVDICVKMSFFLSFLSWFCETVHARTILSINYFTHQLELIL